MKRASSSIDTCSTTRSTKKSKCYILPSLQQHQYQFQYQYHHHNQRQPIVTKQQAPSLSQSSTSTSTYFHTTPQLRKQQQQQQQPPSTYNLYNNNSGNCYYTPIPIAQPISTATATTTCYFKDNIPILPSQGSIPTNKLFLHLDENVIVDDEDEGYDEYDEDDISCFKASINQDLLRIDQLILMN